MQIGETQYQIEVRMWESIRKHEKLENKRKSQFKKGLPKPLYQQPLRT